MTKTDKKLLLFGGVVFLIMAGWFLGPLLNARTSEKTSGPVFLVQETWVSENVVVLRWVGHRYVSRWEEFAGAIDRLNAKRGVISATPIANNDGSYGDINPTSQIIVVLKPGPESPSEADLN